MTLNATDVMYIKYLVISLTSIIDEYESIHRDSLPFGIVDNVESTMMDYCDSYCDTSDKYEESADLFSDALFELLDEVNKRTDNDHAMHVLSQAISGVIEELDRVENIRIAF